jgi:general secretion pathway protein G
MRLSYRLVPRLTRVSLFLVSPRKRNHAVKAECSVSARNRGFTLIELLVVMAIIAILVTIAVPRYFSSVDRSKEAVLRSNLATVREAIDKYYGDRGKYPDSLQELVARRYLRTVPRDPVTDSTTTWVIVPPPDTGKGNVYDIRSGAPGRARDGTEYRSW